MAKTAKSVKKASPAGRKPATRRRPARKATTRKVTPKKVVARKPAVKKPVRHRSTKQSRTAVTAIAELLPTPVGENAYVSRTLTIIEQDQKRRARSRATRARQIEQVVVEMKNDIATRISEVEESAVHTLEDFANRVKAVRVLQQAVALPEQVTEQVTGAVDTVLDRVGLMRKTLHNEALASRPARRRRRAA